VTLASAPGQTSAASDPVGDQAVENSLSRGFVIRETVTVRETIVPARSSRAHAAAAARSLGLSERPGKWAVTPAVRAALAGRTLAEVLPGPRGSWLEDARVAS